MDKLQQIAKIVHEYLPESRTSAVILAAGNSTRMGKENKQFCYLNGKPVLAHTLLAYQKCPLIREIIVVAKPSDFKKIFSIAKQYGINKLTQIVGGGETRQESARRGVAKVSEETKFVAIADGARCLTTPAQITKVCLCAYRQMAACAAHKLTDTIKRATVLGNVQESIDREGLWQMQTPQVFHTALYHAALIKAEEENVTVTDDASLVEHLGYQIHLVECGHANIKITTPDDLPLAQAILNYRTRYKK